MREIIASVLIALSVSIAVSCRSISQSETSVPADLYRNYLKLTPADRQFADSLLAIALDNEGLFTICSDLKPISTVKNVYFQIARDSTMKEGIRNVVDPNHPDLKRIERVISVLERLETDKIGFFVEPFKMVWKGKRAVEILVYRKDLIAEMIKRNQTFFGQWGFVPVTDAELIINTIEFESKYDRYRGYGYLFGYPEHAVDFFVSASQQSDSTGKHVERDFLNMPSYGGEGRYVYAVSKGSGFNEIDSLIYRQGKSSNGSLPGRDVTATCRGRRATSRQVNRRVEHREVRMNNLLAD